MEEPIGNTQEEFSKFMNSLEEKIKEARELGDSTDFVTEPYSNEQIEDIGTLAGMFGLIGTACMGCSDMMRDLITSEIAERN